MTPPPAQMVVQYTHGLRRSRQRCRHHYFRIHGEIRFNFNLLIIIRRIKIKPNIQTFDATAVAIQPVIIRDFNNTATNYTVQTYFSGPAPTYNIECNLGIFGPSPATTTDGTAAEIIVDPNGWAALPLPIRDAGAGGGSTAGLNEAFIGGFIFPIFAIRINVTAGAASASTGTFKILQQGIR